jgi:integrase
MNMKERERTALLSKDSVDRAAPGDKRYVVWDTKLRGFGVRIEAAPSTTKTFIFRYRAGGGRRGTLRQYKLGRYGDITPDEARKAAKEAHRRISAGEDPQAERAADRAILTIGELCDLYVAEGCETKKPTTKALDQIRIDGFIKRRLGTRKITDVTNADVERLRTDIAGGKMAGGKLSNEELALLKRKDRPADLEQLPIGRRVRGGKTAATKVVKILSAMYGFAIRRKLCAENPCEGVDLYADTKRDRFLSPAEMGKLGDALTAAEAEGAQPGHVAIIRLLCLTGARKNEIAQLRWSEVNFDLGILQLADSKTGAKAIRLGAAALEILAGVKRGASPWVFPDPRDRDQPIRNLNWAWVGIRKRAGMEDLRIHDLRHSFASFGIAGGSGLYLIGKLLGHAHVQTTQRYAHLADDPVREAANRISAAVDAALKGKVADPAPIKGAAS